MSCGFATGPIFIAIELESTSNLSCNFCYDLQNILEFYTAWKVFKYGVFSGPNTGIYGPEKTSYLDTFHAVYFHLFVQRLLAFHFDFKNIFSWFL